MNLNPAKRHRHTNHNKSSISPVANFSSTFQHHPRHPTPTPDLNYRCPTTSTHSTLLSYITFQSLLEYLLQQEESIATWREAEVPRAINMAGRNRAAVPGVHGSRYGASFQGLQHLLNANFQTDGQTTNLNRWSKDPMRWTPHAEWDTAQIRHSVATALPFPTAIQTEDMCMFIQSDLWGPYLGWY